MGYHAPPYWLETLLVVVLLLCHGEYLYYCYALQPSTSSHLVKPIHSSSRIYLRNQNTKTHQSSQLSASNNNDLAHLYGEEWEEEASQAILSGFRGGDDNNTCGGYIATTILSSNKILQSIKEGYHQRVSADPQFLSKSILEIILAASTQYMAEVSRRGRDRILPEIDFVFAGVLTAVCGKYYSMWRVARTVDANADATTYTNNNGKESSTNSWRDRVPTNAFQPTLLDGHTTPSIQSRILAFILPMPQLFRAGVIASTLGYGLTSLLIKLRTLLIPTYVVVTKPVSVPLAAIYTGLFMAFISNIRYQLLQGIVEPYLIDGVFSKIETLGNEKTPMGRILGKFMFLKHLKRVVVVLVRWGNGLLGSWIAIGGMRWFGLQQLKE